VILFDEAHAMANAAGEKGERGGKAPFQQGRAGLRLQHALPNARAAVLSAAHLCAFIFPPALRRLYVLRKNDAGGAFVEERLRARCPEAGIECIMLRSAAKDLNGDLRQGPAEAVKGAMIAQFDPADISRFAGAPPSAS
jgi:hypothetical protein